MNLGTKHIVSLLALMCLLLTNCTESQEEKNIQGHSINTVKESDYLAVQKTFASLEYHLDQIGERGIPPAIVAKIPNDLDEIKDTDERKRTFFKIMLPLVLLVNQEILTERELLLELHQQYQKNGSLTSEQRRQLKVIAERYHLDFDSNKLTTLFRILTRRVDIIPVDLALAQAANESGWGGSRFTREANNLFGQWTFIPGRGIVPENRPEGETYEVKSFPTIYDSVRSYANNLNTHSAYQDFRQLRARQRRNGENLKGLILAEGLMNYSTRGEEYVTEIQSMIRSNNLERLAQAQLR